MLIEIKKVQVNQRLSQETHCFSADVWIDGVKAGAIQNAGHGGPDDFFPVQGGQTLAQINERIAREMPEVPGFPSLTNDLEIVVGDLVNAHVVQKSVGSRLKRKAVYVVDGKRNPDGKETAYECDIKGAEKLRTNPKITVLNDLPIADVVKRLTEAGVLH